MSIKCKNVDIPIMGTIVPKEDRVNPKLKPGVKEQFDQAYGGGESARVRVEQLEDVILSLIHI